MLKKSIIEKLDTLMYRHEELSALLGTVEVINDQDKFRNYSKEYAQLEDVVNAYRSYKEILDNLAAAQEMLKEDDADMKAMAKEEVAECEAAIPEQETKLQTLLLPKDPDDESDIYLEIRAGTGGDEAAIFAGDLYRMYARYAENKGWRVELMSANDGEHGGYKEVVARISGQDVYSRLKFESGAHRVQRVPETESQGRIHTSACTVAILPEVKNVEAIEINPSDLKIDTFRASGAGGQHVNKTDSAIRITHLPTNTVVECQDERSQHKNRARAMSILSAKLMAVEKEKIVNERAETRRNLVGSGDRSERIRTYNFPQGRMTDHRINLTLYKLDEIIEGAMDQVIEPLIHEHQADLLSTLSDD